MKAQFNYIHKNIMILLLQTHSPHLNIPSQAPKCHWYFAEFFQPLNHV
jgi:hypothetical protein